MAEKISIHIDLRHSRPVGQKGVTHLNDNHVDKQYLKPPVEYHYRYDRISLLILMILMLIVSLFVMFLDNDSNTANDPTHVPITQRHLNIAENRTLATKHHAIFLSYETINVLDSFVFPETPVLQHPPR